MSISELTTASAWIAALAIVALVAAGWRKPARATARSARATPPTGPLSRLRRGDGVPVIEADAPAHEHTPIWRRIWAVVASSAIGVVTGALLATVLAAAIAWSVVTLTTLLRQ